jgi:hypothetical protein
LADENQVDSFDDLFEPFELEDGPPTGEVPVSGPADSAGDDEHDHDDVAKVSCPSCGTANPAYNRHCEACGARLSTAPLPVASPPMVRATPGGRALGVLVAVVLIAALIALFINVFGGDESPTPQSTTTLGGTATTLPIDPIVELQPSSVEASSELGSQWGANNLIDNDLATEWQDRSLGGRGAELTFRFSQPVSINEIEIYNLPDDARFRANYRIQGFAITVNDLSFEITGRLDDDNIRQVIEVASIETRTLTLTVTSTYDSESMDSALPFDELALADVRFFGRFSG